MAAMQERELIGSRIMTMNEGDITDEALRLALMDYADTVTGMPNTHIWPPYLQLVEEEDGTYLWWLAEAFEPEMPEAAVLKRAVLREYILTVEMEKIGMNDDHFDVFDDDEDEGDIDLERLLREVAALLEEDEELAQT